MADDATPKRRGRETRESQAGGGNEPQGERWTRAAPTRPDLFRQREVRREHLRQAGAPEIDKITRQTRVEGIPGVDRAQRLGGQGVPDLQQYGRLAPRAGVSATPHGEVATDPASAPSGSDSEEKAQERRQYTMSDRDRMINQRPAGNRGSDEERGLARREESGLSGYGFGRGYSPFELIRRFSEDVDRMFAQLGFPSMGSFGLPFETGRALARPSATTGASGLTTWAPSVDVLTRGDDLLVRAELPGIKSEDVNVEVEGNNLVISGESRAESENRDQGYWYSERRYGSFFRSIPLPQGVNAENAQANFNNGVLEITLPGAAKAIQPQRRRIQIAGAGQRQGEQQAQRQPTERGEERPATS